MHTAPGHGPADFEVGKAYDLPIFTIITKMDYVPKSKTLNVIKNVEKQFGGVVLPFSAIDNRYNEKIFDHILNFSKEEGF